MKATIFTKLYFSVLFSCFLLLATGATCKAEQVYQITEQELTALEHNLTVLEQQQKQLLSQLAVLNEQHKKLKEQLELSRTLSQQTEQQLKTANESLQAFANEEKSKRLLVKRQRNTYFCCFLAAGLYAITK